MTPPDLSSRLESWRSWAQFVYLAGGTPEGTDAELQARVCRAHGDEISELQAALSRLEQKWSEETVRVDRLEAEKDRDRVECIAAWDRENEMRHDAEEEVEALRAALLRYGQHLPTCAIVRPLEFAGVTLCEGENCTCKYRQVLADLLPQGSHEGDK